MLERVVPRIGYAAVGLLWITIGAIAARVGLLGSRDRVAGFPRALRVLLEQKEGPWILSAVAVGLAAFALWRGLQAATGRGALTRIGQALAAIGYAALAWTAVRLLLRVRGQSFNPRRAAPLLASPAGRVLLQAAGGILLVCGFVAIVQALTGRLPRWLVVQGLTSSMRRFAARASRFGLAARGMVMIVTGYFLLRAVRDLDPREVHAVGGSLAVLSKSPLGPLAMGIVAVGLVFYGLSMWLLAVSRRPA